jgi:Signal transduction histidine kinase regulating C4-dicarboxylate transport system
MTGELHADKTGAIDKAADCLDPRGRDMNSERDSTAPEDYPVAASGMPGQRQEAVSWRQKLTSRWALGNAGVIAAAALFVVTALMLSGTAARMLALKSQSDDAEAILHECGMLIEETAEMNAAARTYMTIRNPALIDQRDKLKPVIAARFSHLRRLTADEPAEQRRIERAQRLSDLRAKLFDDMLARAGAPGVMMIEGEAERLEVTRSSNAQISAIREWAEADFQSHQDQLTKDMHNTMFLAIVAAIAAPFLGLIGIHLLKLDREDLRARELQLELMHVQRQAIMGETSAMLAHEINQPLSAAGNYLALLRRQIETGNPEASAAVVERVENQIRRAGLILKKLRRFIEKRESERSLQTVDILVEDAITLLGTIDATVQLKTEIADSLPEVLVDRVQMQQVLVNLMRNAIEAMQGCDKRELALSAAPNSHAAIVVSLSDTGPGISPEIAAKLFQPFVSTKNNGMGVGLSICQTIIAQHGGEIWAEPNPEGGTIFRFTLPAAEERAVA